MSTAPLSASVCVYVLCEQVVHSYIQHICKILADMNRLQTLRQILVVSGLTLCSVSDGLIFGQMSGMIKGLTEEDSIKLDENDISWIASIINITCFCGFALSACLTEIYGRRKSITIVSTPVLICWIMVYFATDKTTLLMSRLIVGLCFGGSIFLIFSCVGEYVSPNMRSLCTNFTSCVGTSLGVMIGHILSIFMHWRNVALICIIPTALSAIIPLFWVESPSWLATKNRFDECEISFRALHVVNEATDKELKELIEFQKAKPIEKTSISTRKVYKSLIESRYWKIFLIITVIDIYRVAAGRVYLNTLASTLLQSITGSSHILLYTIIVDGFALLGSSVSCLLVTRFKMRKLLFTSGVIANVIQVTFGISLYVWTDDDQVTGFAKVFLLALYFITVTAGPYAVLETLLTEIHPLDLKSISLFQAAFICGVFQFINIHFSIKMSSSVGYYGIFFVNSVVVFVCLLYLYIYLPETKGRTLQEIECYFRNSSFKSDECSSPEKEVFINQNKFI